MARRKNSRGLTGSAGISDERSDVPTVNPTFRELARLLARQVAQDLTGSSRKGLSWPAHAGSTSSVCSTGTATAF